MGRRKGEDTFAAKRRRISYVAKLRREDPFKPEDALAGLAAPFRTSTSMAWAFASRGDGG
jgi:hypothetical protein